MFHNYVLADDEPVIHHLTQFRQHAIDMLLLVNENDDQRKFATGIHQPTRFYPAALNKACYAMQNYSVRDVLLAQVIEDRLPQRVVMPRGLVMLAEVDPNALTLPNDIHSAPFFRTGEGG